MSYLLASTSIRSPNTMTEENSTQVTQIRTLSGAINRDYFGSNKRVWKLEYKNLQKADYDTINAIYRSYLATGTPVAWQITETNYAVSATTVHVDFLARGFSARGSGYLSDITLILTEA
jgi:hypothetical protein